MNPEHEIRPPATVEMPAEHAGPNSDSSDWSVLLGRMVENLTHIFQLEVRLLESRVAPALTAMVDHALAGIIVVFAGAIGGCCLLVALIVLLHQWLPWWLSFAVGGVVAILSGFIAYALLKWNAARTERAVNDSTT